MSLHACDYHLELARAAVEDHGALQKVDELGAFGCWATSHFLREVDSECEPISGPAIVVEVGSDAGGTLWYWRELWPRAEIFAISLPHGRSSTHRPLEPAGAHVLPFDSHLESTLRTLDACLDGAPIDFVFLDGDHTLGGTLDDFIAYGRRVRSGGVVALHDIVNGDASPDVEVPDLWRWITLLPPVPPWPTVVECVAANPSWGGIGAVVMP